MQLDNLNIGINFTVDTPQEAIKILSFFRELPRTCGIENCGGKVGFQHREVDENDFYELVCLENRFHTCRIGVKRKGGMFCRGEWEIYNGRSTNGNGVPKSSQTSENTPANGSHCPGKKVFETGICEGCGTNVAGIT